MEYIVTTFENGDGVRQGTGRTTIVMTCGGRRTEIEVACPMVCSDRDQIQSASGLISRAPNGAILTHPATFFACGVALMAAKDGSKAKRYTNRAGARAKGRER